VQLELERPGGVGTAGQGSGVGHRRAWGAGYVATWPAPRPNANVSVSLVQIFPGCRRWWRASADMLACRCFAPCGIVRADVIARTTSGRVLRWPAGLH
jgi:hypothetical protein